MPQVYTFKSLESYSELVHQVTQKDDTQAYAFSLALHTNENPADILVNRAALQAQFPTMRFVVANQTHSDHITIIDKPIEQGWRALETAIEDCDALITDQSGIMLTVLTADCVPILLFDPVQKVVATVHAGWKGTYQSIAAKTVQKMHTIFQSDPQDIRVAIAPSIGVCCYEVGEEVARHFFDDPEAYIAKENGKYMLNLPHINQQQLLKAGLEADHIELSDICTACEVDSYFSYRKEQGCSGRFMSMIGLE